MRQKLLLALFALWLPWGAWADVEIDGIYYNLVQKAKIAEVTNGGTTGRYSGDIVIPASVEYEGVTYSVTSIGNNAFEGCSSLTSVVIPNSVTSISGSAFRWCSSLTSVDIPNSVTSIGGSAFEGCSSLTSVVIPNSVTSIGASAFSYCYFLTSVVIPNSVTKIGNYTFRNCSSLTSVVIPNSVTSIGNSTFVNCSSLTSVVISNSVKKIGSSTFYGCTALTSVSLPSSIVAIGGSAFKHCTSLKSVDIPNSVKYIGGSAFYECSDLEEVTIGSGVIDIGNESYFYDSDGNSLSLGNTGNTFALCKNLVTVKCLAESVPSTNANTFDESLIDYCTLYVPEGSLSSYQATEPWSGFGTIKSLSDDGSPVPILVDGIYYAFDEENGTATVVSGATAYTGSVTIPESVSHDGKEYSVTTIAEKAFQGCSGLTGVDIPESVKTIGDYAFSGCNNMTQVTVAWLSPLAINSTVFPNRANCTLYVPQGCQALYQAADYWKEFKEIIDPTIDDDSVDGIFYTYDTEKYTATVTGAKSDLQEVNIPDNVTYEGRVYTVTKIARAAFQDHDMAAVIVPFTMKEIGYDAFRGCKNLVSMKVRSYYEYMQQLVSPFVVQEGITNVDVDGTMDPASKGVNRSLAVMEEEAVYDSRNDCNAIIHKATNMLMAGCQTTVIPEDVVKIGDHAFYGQTNLTSISIPSSVTILGSGAFYDCKNLESVVLNEGLVTIGSCAFLNCEKLGSIKIPISVKKIDEFAFVNCKSLNKAIVSDLSAWCAISFINRDSNPIFRSGKLYSDENTEVKELVIPEEVTSIGNYAFYNCDGITSVTLPSSLASIGSSAFYACDNITSVSLPATVTAIGQDALMGCDLLTTITAYMTAPPTLTAQFANAEKITLYVPRGTKALYEAADYWKDFMEIIEMEEVIDVTDISQLDVAIYTDNVEINKGTQATLSVKMKNNVVAEGFEFNLRLPDGMDVALDQDGFPMVALSTERTNSRKTNTFETVIQNDGSLHILGASTNGSTISGNDGEIVLVTVNVSDEMKEGSYPIVIENIVISDEMAKAYEVESVTSAITIVDYTAGDVNMDGKVNVADYTAIAHHIMGNTPNVFNKKAADANGDGKINVADLTAVAHLIMYGSVERPKSLPMVINPE